MKNRQKKLVVKQQLLETCKQMQNKTIDTAREAMNQAQSSANEEKGTAEEKFESFRAQLQIDRDMYAKQLQEAISASHILEKLQIDIVYEEVVLGSVVVTSQQNFFICISIGEIKIDKKKYYAISPLTPLYKAMAGKKKGDSFTFRDKSFLIEDVF
jgi:transcription elongation GreA/GreB family factor